MTREKFLTDLEVALAAMKPEEIEGVIAYYKEMIDDRMEAGMTEEAAVAAMEPVTLIAARVLNEAGVDAKDEKENGKMQEIRRNAADIRKLRIMADNKRILFGSDETDEIILRYRIDGNDVFQLHEDDGVLTLEHTNRPVASFANDHKGKGISSLDDLFDWVGRTVESIGKNLVRVNISADTAPIEVILPRVYKGFVQAESKDARIVMENITCMETLRMATSNARIEMSKIVSRGIEAVSTNGRIVMNDVYAREGISAVTSNGRIVTENVSSDRTMHLATSNGRVELGNVSAHDISVKTSNGTVCGTVKGTEAEYTIHSVTSNGSNNLGNRGDGEKTLNVVTSNSSVNVTFTDTAV